MRYRRIDDDRVKLFILEYKGESLDAIPKVKPGLEALFLSNIKPGLEALSSRQKHGKTVFHPPG